MKSKKHFIIPIILLVIAITGGAWYFYSKSTIFVSHNELLRVSIITWPGMGPGFIAQEHGFFGETKVDFKVLDNTIDRRAAFQSGNIDLHITTLDQLAIESAAGLRGKAILLTEQSNGADGIVAQSSINSISDLKGKRIAYAEGTPSHFFLLHMLSQNNLQPLDIQSVVVDDPSKAGEAFIAQSVDAAVTWEPFLSQAISQSHAKMIANTKELPGVIIGVFVVSDRTLAERREDIERFTFGWLRAVEMIQSDPSSTYPIMAQKLGIPETDFSQMMDGIKLLDKNQQVKYLIAEPSRHSLAEDLFTDAAKLWVKAGLIKSFPDAEAVFDRNLLNSLYTKKLPTQTQ